MRTHTPPETIVREDGTTTTRHKVQRACNGCGRDVGDVTEAEMEAVINGRPLADVRDECPWCAMFLAEEPANA